MHSVSVMSHSHQVVKNKCGAIWLFDGECGNGASSGPPGPSPLPPERRQNPYLLVVPVMRAFCLFIYKSSQEAELFVGILKTLQRGFVFLRLHRCVSCDPPHPPNLYRPHVPPRMAKVSRRLLSRCPETSDHGTSALGRCPS